MRSMEKADNTGYFFLQESTYDIAACMSAHIIMAP